MSLAGPVYIAQYIIYINENFSAVTLVDGSSQEDDTRMSYLLIEKQHAAGPSVSNNILGGLRLNFQFPSISDSGCRRSYFKTISEVEIHCAGLL